MQSQTTNSRAKTLGPFLTLIFSAAKRNKAALAAFRPESAQSLTSPCIRFAKVDEGFHATKSTPPTLLMPGPFLTMILTLGRRQPEKLMEITVRI